MKKMHQIQNIFYSILPLIFNVKFALITGGIPLSATHSYNPASLYDTDEIFRTLAFFISEDCGNTFIFSSFPARYANSNKVLFK